MEPIVILVVALLGVVLAWKLLKGLVKTVVLVGILALAAIYVFGGMN
jgi:hydrogenase/urease accessory protein HupE